MELKIGMQVRLKYVDSGDESMGGLRIGQKGVVESIGIETFIVDFGKAGKKVFHKDSTDIEICT